MKTLLSIFIFVLVSVVAVQAQSSGDYKHPYGLTQTSKSQKVTKAVSTDRKETVKVKRNYKNPQTEKEEVATVAPGRTVETVVNPLTATDNYKRQNRNTEADNAPNVKENDIMVQDSLNKNNKKD
ncbi:hypothetical protein QNI19_10105 [Cytophagaceae bacterium DM2B3-1]|uniref:Uncharacterized protein n=1 Tax=Xanthocytophaga flava TaxID=3048013 RepID=A0AAE3QN44_9BACT|nr:hypothetical protein [Xanthocytophaga flavus]MDJ1468398.1 hypothetical protein [Xanthocytophaga flavus]MDJ1480470.1 hypothetical protein [Xanthocytophaga flavus]MDJ1493284.1 hypothetical protein [Xanthocytophaga flavus]